MDLFNSSSAIFSPDRKHRYVLYRIWDTSKKPIAFIGLNPSTANEVEPDNTITRVKNFAYRFGAGGFYMLNLFSLVSPHPEDLLTCPDPIRDNDDYLKKYTDLCDKVVFVWGAFKQTKGRDEIVRSMFSNAYCLGKNANGSPKHPLYLKADCDLVPF